jgi:hypothetical protein
MSPRLIILQYSENLLTLFSAPTISNALNDDNHAVSNQHSAAPNSNTINTFITSTQLEQPQARRASPLRSCCFHQPSEAFCRLSGDSRFVLVKFVFGV